MMEDMDGKTHEIAVFGGGCFWCTEAVFERLRGVVSVMPGYAGGHTEHPTYESVRTGETGHAEATRVEFDPSALSYEDLLTVFFATHDPTSLNRQGDDVGTQYRSAIFYATDAQKRAAERFIADLNASAAGGKPIVTTLEPLGPFTEAEEYHRQYYETHKDEPYCRIVIDPKLAKLKERFGRLLKDQSA